MIETQAPSQTPIDRVLALKAARRAELVATESRRQQEERAAAEADAAAFEQALSEVLAREDASWLLEFRVTEARRKDVGEYYHRIRLYEVRFNVPAHRLIAAVIARQDERYGSVESVTDGNVLTWCVVDASGHETLADALIAAEEIPY
ncbi:hypothetical protein R5W24_004468 [Gemmata sp. JC717]|uniref:hypothetical protein n=1 Tax=Gemmata algarum TaxID=2975278 RepID=UPI0021BAFB64|nr:hypothetical protein [Gemmata algarum]MDY3555326.1 hypothetical protein [Gemmata algarum]